MAIFPDYSEATANMYQRSQGRWPGSNPNDSSAAAKTGDTAAIQAAIDFAFANNLRGVSIPPGTFYCDPGIYVDPPGNLRANLGVPTMFGFSLHLEGAGGGNNNNFGTTLVFPDNSQSSLIIGTGQGMKASGFNIVSSATTTSRAALPANGIGVALAGGSGGLSRVELDDILVKNFRKGFCTGFNANGLCDSVTLHKCTAFENYIGIHFSQNQNWVNTLEACDFGGNTTHILSDVAKPVNVFGGNYSTSDAVRNAFAITNVSSLTYGTDSSQVGFAADNATFTVTLTAPDQAMADGAYDVFAINTTAFGPVPLLKTAYNSGTGVLTLKFYQGWLLGIGLQTATLNGGNLQTIMQTALQAATTLYACERTTTFEGLCFNVEGTHHENPGMMTRLFHFNSGFGGENATKMNRLTFNWPISNADMHGGTGAQEAAFQCQQAFPFIEMLANSKGSLELSNIDNTTGFNDRILIDVQEASIPLSKRLIFRNCDIRPNVRCAPRPIGSGPINSDFQSLSTAYGWGEYDDTPFWATGDTLRYYAQNMVGAVPFRGHLPSPNAVPHIDPTTLAAILAGPGSIGSYPALVGRVPYRVEFPTPYDAVAGTQSVRWVESNHTFWSYGQNLTINWSYVAGTNWLVLSDTSRMFAGLHILLNNGGGNEQYIVTGVYPSLGGATVVLWRTGTSNTWLAGTYGTTYTGATIGQEAFSITALQVPQAPNTQSGSTYSVALDDTSIIANNASGTLTLTLPSASSSNGRVLMVKTIQNQTVVSAGSNVVPLAGGAAGTAILAGTAGKWAQLQSDGSNWNIMAAN